MLSFFLYHAEAFLADSPNSLSFRHASVTTFSNSIHGALLTVDFPFFAGLGKHSPKPLSVVMQSTSNVSISDPLDGA
ncbi:hypothetical protein D3C76_1336410 [compost metagenome]